MKKQNLCMLVLFGLLPVTTMAQDYKAVKVGLGLGYAHPAGEGSKGGVLFYLEPAYRVNDKIAVGLRIEGAIMGRVAVVSNSSSSSVEAEVAANGSYTVNGQYYFSNKYLRPFAGLGLGIYSLASAKVSGNSSGSTSTSEVSGGSKFGFYPRVGFDLGHFSFNLEYNLIPDTEATVIVTNASGGTSTANSITRNSYLGVKLGFFFGGGKK